jgi:DNA invertase Pin-like site-specific DNA recombinase
MNDGERVSPKHVERKAMLYVRQSSQHQIAHNQESRRLQYAMEPRLRALGWHDVEVIDEDLGRSATSTLDRTGFQRMVADVGLGKVGAIAAREVSRFARNNRDWHQLIEMCGLVDTLLVDHEAVYDVRRGNDRLLLGLKGSLSEYELDLLRQRSLEARRQKARRGELLVQAPVGYIKTVDQRIEKDPDLRVQQAISLVFDKFLEIGTVRQTLMWLIEHRLQLPTRRHGPGGWEPAWKRPAYRTVLNVLRNPTYGGAYVYGRTETTVVIEHGEVRRSQVRKPRARWSVLIPSHHDGYITWDVFERISTMITRNSQAWGSAGPGAAKGGASLLAGLLRCRRCGRKLMVTYTGRRHDIARYVCSRGSLDNGEERCLSFGGMRADQVLAREVLRVVQPGAVAASRAATEVGTRKRDELRSVLLTELKAVQYEAERARRQYDTVDPENRLVADELERRWNAALVRVQDIEARVREEEARVSATGPAAEDGLEKLGQDLPRIWNAPESDFRLKKRIVRTLVEEVVVDVQADAGEIELVIHWKGGVHSSIRMRRRRRGENGSQTSKGLVDAVTTLALVCSDVTIASTLNRNQLRTGRGNRWTRERVTSLRSHHEIPVRPSAGAGEWMNLGTAAAHARVSPKTLRRLAEAKRIKAQHPLPVGPWVFSRADLDRPEMRCILAAINGATAASPVAGPNARQLILGIPTT